jgi:ribosomal protein L11 methyltransferase
VIRLSVRCRPELAERVLAELVELVPGGVEEDVGAGYVEYAIYGPPGELPELPELEAAAGDGLVAIETTEVPDDWADRWRDFHEPIRIGERLIVRPSWEAGAGDEADIDIVVDPGQAFGTGAHATTRMCLELLLAAAGEGLAAGPLVDLGTGSGVLAIAAAKLGWGPVSGCDHERPAIAAAGENARANGVELTLERVNLRTEPAPFRPATVANLTAPLLVEVAGLMAPERRPRLMIVSGLLVSEADRVRAAFAVAGLGCDVARQSGEWAALRLSC